VNVNHATNAPSFCLFFRSDTFLPFAFTKARFAVTFSIASGQYQASFDLSFFLLRFLDYHIRESDYSRFHMLALSYEVHPTRSYGVMIFDHNFAPAFSNVVSKCTTHFLDDRFGQIPMMSFNGSSPPQGVILDTLDSIQYVPSF